MWLFKMWFVFYISVASAIGQSKNDTSVAVQEGEYIANAYMFIFTALFVGSFFRAVTKAFRLIIPVRVLLLFFGALIGVVSRYSSTVKQYCEIVSVGSKYLLMTCLPIVLFKASFCIDGRSFLRSSGQIFLVAVPGLMISAVSIGLMMTIVLQQDWSYSMGILFGIVCSPTSPIEIIAMFNEQGHSKHLAILLEGESIIGDGISFLIFETIMGHILGPVYHGYQILLAFLRSSLCGLLAGLVIGFITSFLIGKVSSDPINSLSVTLASAYLSFYIGQELLTISGVIMVVVVGIMASFKRTNLSPEVEMFLMQFWDMMAYGVNSVLFFIVGIVFTQKLIDHIAYKDYALIFVTYVVVFVTRFITFLLLAPILSRIGYGLSFQDLVVAVWAGLRGVVSFCFTMVIFYNEKLHRSMGRELLVHVASLVALTLLINAMTMPTLLRLLGLSEHSHARIANMNNCMKHLLDKRDRTIAILKMDRFLADANWPLVSTATTIKHPYKINISDSDDEEIEDYWLGNRPTACPDCKREIPHEPTVKEMKNMIKEARLRILKAKKISYARQYEKGMITKDGMKVLVRASEMAMDTQAALVELDGLHKLFQHQGFFYYLRRKLVVCFQKSQTIIKQPRKFRRRICYHIIMHPAFNIFIYCVILLNTIPIGLEIGLNPRSGTTLASCLKGLNTVFFAIYFFEFLLKIYGYSWIYVFKHGFRTYFRSYWNIFDFFVLVVALVDLGLDYIDVFVSEFDKSDSTVSTVTTALQLIRIIRLIRLLRLCIAWYPWLIKFCDSKIDKHLAYAYDIGKGFVTGQEEVSEMLPYMIDNKVIREDCRLSMEADRLAITKELGMIQKDRPWISITVKTRQAIRETLNSMAQSITELKVSGWIGDVEFKKLMESMEERFKFIRSHVKSIDPSPPEVLLKEVSWMANDEAIFKFFYENVVTKEYDSGDVVYMDGEMPNGIYLIVTGLLKLTYIPKKETIYRLNEYGALPVTDCLMSTRFNEQLEDYIVSGNCIGELGALTGRQHDCTIIAETPSQVYMIDNNVLKQAMEKEPDEIVGLDCRLWKCVSVRLAAAVLMDTPAYQSATQEKIRSALERAFVPNLSRYKMFTVNDMMEDVILIEGVVVDFSTREYYTAPCYIPRTAQKLILPRSSHMRFETTIETKLMIIPTRDVDEFEIMEREEEISEMVQGSSVSMKCLQHSALDRAAKQKKRKRQMFNLGGRRVVKRGRNNSNTTPSPHSSRSQYTIAGSIGGDTETHSRNMSFVEENN